MRTNGGFSIGHASQLTGLSTHTLRVWERRYGFPTPKRTDGGARRYTTEDLERLGLIVEAMRAGFKPGDVVGMLPDELRRRLAGAVGQTSTPERPFVDDLVEIIRNDDLEKVKSRLRQALATHGPREFLIEVVDPLMRAVGAAWAAGELSVQREHLLTEIVSTKLRVLASAYVATDGRPRVLLTTLPGEHHRMGIDMAGLYLAIHRAEPLALGPSTPVDQIVAAARTQRADVVGVSVSASANAEAAAAELTELLEALPRRVELWLGGQGSLHPALAVLPARGVHGWDALDAALANWRRER